MRTTIEITDEQRARLLELAARRGEKGFSRLIQEALDQYLRALDERREARTLALGLRGSFKADEAERLRDETARLRGSWR